jgi:chromosome segregation ATPase
MPESSEARHRLDEVERETNNTREAVGRLNDKLDRVGQDVKVILEMLTGNGEPSKGLIVRQDRLEQTVSRWAKLITIALGTAITALVGAAVKLVLKP